MMFKSVRQMELQAALAAILRPTEAQ